MSTAKASFFPVDDGSATLLVHQAKHVLRISHIHISGYRERLGGNEGVAALGSLVGLEMRFNRVRVISECWEHRRSTLLLAAIHEPKDIRAVCIQKVYAWPMI
jgi:hypothetical protein